MKLIIDVPDEVLKSRHYCQYFGAWSTKLTETIENGIPYEERPQGEWIDHSEEGYVECPFCKHLTNCEDNIDELHYCWNCGAHLQKGGAE